MRVTDLTKQASVLRNVQKNSNKLQELQENMSSGRRINKLSDDPIGATQAQDFRTKISFFDMLQEVTSQTFTWLDRSEAELSHIGDLLGRTKVLVLAAANDSNDEAGRRVTAEEVQDIIETLQQSGNAKIGKVYIFSGSKTLTRPLQEGSAIHSALVSTDNLDSDLQFLLEAGQFEAEFEGFSQHPLRVRIVQEGPLGRAHYVVSDDGGESWGREITLLPEIEVYNEDGLPSDKVFLRFRGAQENKLGEPIIFPKGLELVFESNPPVAYLGNDDKRKIPTSEGILQPFNVTAREVFFRDESDPDSINTFDMLYSLKRALVDNDRNVLEQRLGDLDKSFDQVLNKRAELGAVRKELEDQLDKLTDREFNSIKQMSDLEDLDFPSAVMEMNLADTRNRATLDTSARLIQPSLLNFLR